MERMPPLRLSLPYSRLLPSPPPASKAMNPINPRAVIGQFQEALLSIRRLRP